MRWLQVPRGMEYSHPITKPKTRPGVWWVAGDVIICPCPGIHDRSRGMEVGMRRRDVQHIGRVESSR